MIKASNFYRIFILLAFTAYIYCFVLAVISASENYWDGILNALVTPISFTIFIAFFAVAFALENYLRKTDLNITGKLEFYEYQNIENGYSYDTGIESFQLNNYKDKTIVIYKVYLRLKRNLYIELLDASKNPILLKAYDTYYKKLDQPLFYLMNNKSKLVKRLGMGNVRLFLDTNEGNYQVKKAIKTWELDHKKILYPVIPSKKYDFNYRFIITDGMAGINKKIYVKYGQEKVEIWSKSFDLSNIKDAEDLKVKLNQQYGSMARFTVYSAAEIVNKDYPLFKDREILK